MPAPVQISPWRMKIGSASTSISGCSAASWPAVDQCVVARLPSSSPAAASRWAPTQTLDTRRERAASARTRPLASAGTELTAAQVHRSALATTGDLYGVVVESPADLG